MTTTALNCANCGAPLDVPATVRFATCRHCGSSLEIHRSESAIWTEMLAQVADVAEAAGEMREDLAALRADREIERLDQEWEKRPVPLPSGEGIVLVFLGIFAAGIVIVGVKLTVSFSSPLFFAIPLVCFSLVVALAARLATKAGESDDTAAALRIAELTYRERRAELVAKLVRRKEDDSE